MALKGFTFWRTYADIGEELSERDQKELYFAIVRYLMFDDDREEKLNKNVRIAFKALKPNLKTSRSRSESGRNGNELRWNKAIANESQSYRKDIAKESQFKDKDKDKDKGQERPAACPKCGGPLNRTGMHHRRGSRDEYMHVCAGCGAEVWA